MSNTGLCKHSAAFRNRWHSPSMCSYLLVAVACTWLFKTLLAGLSLLSQFDFLLPSTPVTFQCRCTQYVAHWFVVTIFYCLSANQHHEDRSWSVLGKQEELSRRRQAATHHMASGGVNAGANYNLWPKQQGVSKGIGNRSPQAG